MYRDDVSVQRILFCAINLAAGLNTFIVDIHDGESTLMYVVPRRAARCVKFVKDYSSCISTHKEICPVSLPHSSLERLSSTTPSLDYFLEPIIR